MLIRTDYLVVGAGASGLAFADQILAAADVEVTVIDRREVPGGHWADTYPFVRLHTPSAYYGVNSLALGEDRIDEAGENAGFYERARGPEIFDYFAEAAQRLSQTGRCQLLLGHEHLGGGGEGERVRELASGEVHEVEVRRKVVDARYLEGAIPATHTPSFEVAAGARLVPVNELPSAAQTGLSYSVLGSGKTAVDACMWLLDNGVEPERIRWVRPREAWFYDRRHFQPLDQVGAIMEGNALDIEAAVNAVSIEDLFERLEASGRMSRIDRTSPATMYRGTMLSANELSAMRQIEEVVRLGRVRSIESDRMVLEQGETPTSSEVLHVDCTAIGISNAPATPIFQPGRIVIQSVRHLSPSFNAALLAFVETNREDDAERNRLCPPNPYPTALADWPRMMSRTWRTEALWLGEPDLGTWVLESRLNLIRALPDHLAEPAVQSAVERYLTQVGTAIERLRELEAPPGS